MQSLSTYQSYINTELLHKINNPVYQEPRGLYKPCMYMLKNGGKRVRASLVLMTAKLFGVDYSKAVDIALAFETFHNFTLIHDDIMDEASIRRGQQTVHVKWDVNTAILSGDAVMIMAYTFFQESACSTPQLFSLLNTTALEVCEGQQYDIDLEKMSLTDEALTEDLYIKMIELKTSVLIAACLKAGAMIAQASIEDADLLYDFGKNVGIAFQLQDDLLDTYGNEDAFGKQIGGDIIENKKTYLVIKALQCLKGADADLLLKLYSDNSVSETQKAAMVTELFDKACVREQTERIVAEYFTKAESYLDRVSLSHTHKNELYAFMHDLQTRAF
ncbi:MAG: polyprenyl synthetase family protein [Bacteroidales bacterium]